MKENILPLDEMKNGEGGKYPLKEYNFFGGDDNRVRKGAQYLERKTIAE